MDWEDSYQESSGKKQTLQYKKAATISKGFFEIEDLTDYNFEKKNDQRELIEENTKNNKNQDIGLENLNFSSPHKRRKNNRNIKLQPLQKQAPQVVAIGLDETNPENQSEDRKIQKVKKPRATLVIDFSDDEEERKQEKNGTKSIEFFEEDQKYQQQVKNELISKNSSEIDETDLISPFNFAFQAAPKGKSYKFQIKRDKQWLNRLRPVFHLYNIRNNKQVMSAKMVSNNTVSTYLISLNYSDFTENGPSYLGKIKTNFTGSQTNIYSTGLNPKDASQKGIKPRQLLATVDYETNFFGSTKPRDFSVYVMKENTSYYDLKGIKKGQDQTPLNQLYLITGNKAKIEVFKNRKPEWNQKIGGYMLNFNGRAKKASIKNFILEAQSKEELMMLGKVDEDTFRIDVGHPLNSFIGLTIALSSFGSKIGCE